MKRLVLLGASGSIGTQTINVVEHHCDEFKIIAFSIGHNIDMLHELIKRMPHVKHICVADKEDMEQLQNRYQDIEFYFGEEGLKELASLKDYDIFVNAIVGFRG
ncbi:MAG: 1-deoxy-D-xylulose-5-phosphate reductoisomerase, partial [Longicatena sp.]